jgi:glycerophosphoryl diester phosphodiesterase
MNPIPHPFDRSRHEAASARPFIMAHRGNMVRCPENTLAAFRQGVADGADIIETDVRVSSDGVFVCMHDETVNRTTDGSGRVVDMPLKELKKLSASGGRGEFREERIPTFQEFCEVIPPGIHLAAELKADEFRDEEPCRRFAAELDRLGVRGRTMVLSFQREKLEAFGRVAPDVEAGFLTLMRPCPCNTFKLQGPLWPVLLMNPFYVMWAHARKQMVCPLDPTPDRLLRFYLWMGCDAVLSNDPAVTRKRIARLKGIQDRA